MNINKFFLSEFMFRVVDYNNDGKTQNVTPIIRKLFFASKKNIYFEFDLYVCVKLSVNVKRYQFVSRS